MWYNLYLLVAMLTSHLGTLMPSSNKTRSDATITIALKETVNEAPKRSNGDKDSPSSSSSLYDQYKMYNFSTFARRVSDKKCFEYIYEMLERQKNANLRDSKDITIINGKVVKAAEYPHMGALGWWSRYGRKPLFLCGASLISDSFMLTAAHCTYAIRRDLSDPRPQIVRLGTRYLTMSPYEPPKDVRIHSLTTYPYYRSPLKYYDIALVKLVEKVTFSKFIQPACLPNAEYSFTQLNTQVIATGWGSINGQKFDSHSTVLRYGVVDIFDNEVCNFLLNKFKFRYWEGLKPHQMCAGQVDGSTDTCQGDSGGPLQYLLLNTTSEGSIHRILSVTAFGLTNCASKNAPGIYTKVSSFIDWIERNVWPNEVGTLRRYKKVYF